jgi:hypothetical protein
MRQKYGSDLAPQELIDEAAKILAKDQARNSGLNYPIYRGQTIAPMSSLTQRARTLKEGFAAKPAPYSQKLESVLNRSNAGVSPQNIQNQLGNLSQGQQNFSDNKMLGSLRKQFRQLYDPKIDNFRNKGQKDLRTSLQETSKDYDNIARASGVLEQSSNQQLAKKLQELQSQKEARREGLIGTLDQFGAQKHGYTNLANKVAQNSFNQEASLPYKKMEMLREALGPLSGNMELGVHPDIQFQSGKDALQALRAYGVDVSKPVEEWGEARTVPTTYKGKLMADLPPEILASHSTLEEVSPKYKDSFYDKRKGIVQQLMRDDNVGNQAMANVPERMRGPIQALESDAKKRFKKDLAAINNQYIRANNYGSSQHLKDAEERARQISKATLAERNKLLQDAMKSELSLGHQGQLSNLQQLGLYGEQGQKEFGDTLGKIREMNKLGSTKWGNEQAENEELYKNYQNEAAWEWPHMKGVISGNARRGALGDVFRGMENRNISLDELAALNTNYSELQKENLARRGELSTRDATIDDLQRQLGVFNKQKEASSKIQKFLDLNRESDDMTNWWNTFGSKSGNTEANWKRVEEVRARLAAIENEARANMKTWGNDAWNQAVAASRARHLGYNTAANQIAGEKQRLDALRLEAASKAKGSRFDQMSPIDQHAYRNYGSEAEYAANHDRFIKEHFAGQHAGGGNRGNTLPWRATESQRQAFWKQQ